MNWPKLHRSFKKSSSCLLIGFWLLAWIITLSILVGLIFFIMIQVPITKLMLGGLVFTFVLMAFAFFITDD